MDAPDPVEAAPMTALDLGFLAFAALGLGLGALGAVLPVLERLGALG
jgi:hypothetical protein